MSNVLPPIDTPCHGRYVAAVQAPAPVAVPVEVRALDTGERLDRVWRLTRSIGEDGLVFSRELPFEPGRPVRLSLVLPDDESGLELTGVVQGVAPDDPEREG